MLDPSVQTDAYLGRPSVRVTLQVHLVSRLRLIKPITSRTIRLHSTDSHTHTSSYTQCWSARWKWGRLINRRRFNVCKRHNTRSCWRRLGGDFQLWLWRQKVDIFDEEFRTLPALFVPGKKKKAGFCDEQPGHLLRLWRQKLGGFDEKLWRLPVNLWRQKQGFNEFPLPDRSAFLCLNLAVAYSKKNGKLK